MSARMSRVQHERRVVEGETFGAPVPGRWPGGPVEEEHATAAASNRHPRPPRHNPAEPRLRITIGVALCLAVAVTLTALLRSFFHSFGPRDWQGWRIVEPIAVTAAWGAAIAWALSAWRTATICLLATLIGPWGYLYPGPLLVLILACGAASRGLRRTAS
ncbi:MAG: hypothetical protein QOH34_1584 [Mycobacterium sp.]|nr:hypothetical protein [Mycobacterium sp.]